MVTFATPKQRGAIAHPDNYREVEHQTKKGAIAQLVEQRTENPCVPGSIPGGTTKRGKMNVFPLFYFSLLLCIFRQSCKLALRNSN